MDCSTFPIFKTVIDENQSGPDPVKTTTEEKTLYKKVPFFEGMGVDVGCLRCDWTLPSDHLPIGITLLGVDSINIASWNVLNNEYLKYVIGDYQGLNGSTITDENKKISDEGLTLR